MTILHKDIKPVAGDPLAGTHVLHYYTFIDVAAMAAGVDTLLGAVVFTANDVGKVARVRAAAPYSFYVLTEHLGPTWESLDGGISGYNGPLDALQNGVAELHIGSIYLKAGQTVSAVTSSMLGTQAGGTANLRMRRFTGGAVIWTISAVGVGLSVGVLGAPAAIPADDYYDLFLFGDAAPTVSLVKALRLVLS